MEHTVIPAIEALNRKDMEGASTQRFEDCSPTSFSKGNELSNHCL
jgi:hypothetical protein